MSPGTVHAQEVSVPAVFHRQEQSLSCEIATLKMALQVHDISVSERELISQLAFDPTPKGSGIWGDPYTGFVGKIDGRMLVDGYGVYWDPIAAVGNKYAVASVMKNGSPSQLARAIASGNPVIIWGHYGTGDLYSWKTPAGKQIRAVDGEHTRIVYGFDGPVYAPTRLYLIDPFTGPFSWSPDELMDNWSSFDHTGVVVSKSPLWVRIPGEIDIWELDSKKNVRRLITTWGTFIARGGSSGLVVDIARATLTKYVPGTSIK